MKEIEGYTNYLVTEKGEVYSKHRKRFLKPDVNVDGYLIATLSKEGKTRKFRIHRLVAEAFIENPEDCPVVNHKDGDKQNNHKDNLEWTTVSGNTKHAFDTGLRNYGEKSYQAKLTNKQVREICELISLGLTRGRILEKHPNVSKYQFDDIRRRKSWKRVTKDYVWT